MPTLLDTHAWIWWVAEDRRLSLEAHESEISVPCVSQQKIRVDLRGIVVYKSPVLTDPRRNGVVVWRPPAAGWNHTNVWAPISLDEGRGLVYLPVSTPSNDYYGGRRLGGGERARGLQPQQDLPGMHALALAHGDGDDALGCRRRQDHAVIFQGAQRLRRCPGTPGQQQREQRARRPTCRHPVAVTHRVLPDPALRVRWPARRWCGRASHRHRYRRPGTSAARSARQPRGRASARPATRPAAADRAAD